MSSPFSSWEKKEFFCSSIFPASCLSFSSPIKPSFHYNDALPWILATSWSSNPRWIYFIQDWDSLSYFLASPGPWKLSGAPSTPVPPGIRPVTHLFLSEVTSDSVLVAWSAPAPPADLFILSYSSADGTDTSKVTLDGSKTASLIQGLLPSTPYTISLITIQADVTSDPITASLTTGETLRETREDTKKVWYGWREGAGCWQAHRGAI